MTDYTTFTNDELGCLLRNNIEEAKAGKKSLAKTKALVKEITDEIHNRLNAAIGSFEEATRPLAE